MASTLEISDGKGIIKFDGALTVNCSEEIRMLLIKALIDADQVLMDFGDVTEADLSSLQLLCSAHRTAVRLKKRLSYVGAPPEVFRRSVEEAGFARATGCRLDCEKSCLWAPKEHNGGTEIPVGTTETSSALRQNERRTGNREDRQRRYGNKKRSRT